MIHKIQSIRMNNYRFIQEREQINIIIINRYMAYM